MNRFVKLSRFKEIRPEIIIVQPGLSKANHTADQTAVLAAAYSYLKETVGVDLDVICKGITRALFRVLGSHRYLVLLAEERDSNPRRAFTHNSFKTAAFNPQPSLQKYSIVHNS